MNIRLFGCGKFKYLAIEKFDRQLTPKELDFYRKHREVCFTCMRYEQQGTNAMNLLSAAIIEPQISDNFDERVLRMLRTQPKRAAFGYWSPVIAGAAVAGLALVATLQLLSRTGISVLDPAGTPIGAYRYNTDAGDRAATQPTLVLPSERDRS